MAELTAKTVVRKIIRVNEVTLPNAFIEENDIKGTNTVDVMYGKNYQCVVIVPTSCKLGAIMKERINKLTTEPLSTER